MTSHRCRPPGWDGFYPARWQCPWCGDRWRAVPDPPAQDLVCRWEPEPKNLPAVIEPPRQVDMVELVDAVLVPYEPEIVEDLHFDIQPIKVASVKPREETCCWWRCGPNIRNRFTTAAQEGIVGIRRYDGDPHRLGLIHSDGTIKDAMILREPFMTWGLSIEAWPGRGKLPEEEQVHEDLQYLDICTPRPPAFENPVQWQQMSRYGDTRYPGTDMRNWTFNDPWEDIPAGVYTYNQPASAGRRKEIDR